MVSKIIRLLEEFEFDADNQILAPLQSPIAAFLDAKLAKSAKWRLSLLSRKRRPAAGWEVLAALAWRSWILGKVSTLRV
jgi:hypothetical protein